MKPKYFDQPPEWSKDATKAPPAAADDAPKHRRASHVFDLESEGESGSESDGEEKMSDTEREEQRAPASTPHRSASSQSGGASSNAAPTPPLVFRGLDLVERSTLLQRFGDELYAVPGRLSNEPLVKPQMSHYIRLGWHNHPEVYAKKIHAMMRDPKYADLIRHIRADLSPGAQARREVGDGEVRRYIEQKIFIMSNHGRSYAQKQWAYWFRGHHTPLCVRELFEVYGDSVLYDSMRQSLENCDSDRDALLISMIADFKQNPFALSLDNFQKGFKAGATSLRETSKYFMMTDVSAVWADVRPSAACQGVVGSIERRPGFPMTCESDFGTDAEDDEFCSLFEVALEWLKGTVAPPWWEEQGLPSKEYLTVLGKALHTGRFGISHEEHFGVGAFNLHPDRDVDTVILLCLLMSLVSQIHCPQLGPAAIPFAMVFTLDQKCYDNVRKAISVSAGLGHHIFDAVFPVPDHWHATQAAGFAALLTGIGWQFFHHYRKAVMLDRYNSGLTPDHFSRKMNFNIMYRHLNTIKLGWTRVRISCLKKFAEARTRGDYIDPDLEAFVTWNEYVVPVVYDLLQVVKKCTPEMYMKALVHFVVVLYMLDRRLYVNAFDFYLRDLLRVKNRHVGFHHWFMANLNRVAVCLHIEYQHKLLAPFTEHLSERDADAVDRLISTLPQLRNANTHVQSYPGLIKPRADAFSLASLVHAENHVSLWSSEAKTTFDLLLSVKAGRQASTITGDTVRSPRLGDYAAKLTRRCEFPWSAFWSKSKQEDDDSGG